MPRKSSRGSPRGDGDDISSTAEGIFSAIWTSNQVLRKPDICERALTFPRLWVVPSTHYVDTRQYYKSHSTLNDKFMDRYHQCQRGAPHRLPVLSRNRRQ